MTAHASPRAHPPVAPDAFTRAMGQHAASVCVITTCLGPQRFGLTATAMASVSAAPPRLLVCVNKAGQTHQMIGQAGRFCVNVLSEHQDAVAQAFAGMLGKDVDRFASGAWTTLATGAPVLVAASASFDCEVAETVDQSTHTVFFGDVVAVASRTGEDALLYAARRFRQLRRIHAAPEVSGETLHF